MEQYPLLFEIARDIGLPIVTLLIGWFGQAWRSKAQKKADELDNTQQIINMQREYIATQQHQLAKYNMVNQRLEAKLDRKNKSIRQANKCKFTNEGDGCPVLTHEENGEVKEDNRCETCQYNPEVSHADGQD